MGRLKLAAAVLLLALTAGQICHAQISDRSPSDRAPDPARTEGLRSKGFGVFFHYLSGLQNNAETVNSLGKETGWDECVDEFDVERFANQVAETGAGYVFFTMMQQDKYLCAPNATFDRLTGYKPGEACSKRDLVMEIADALEARGIDLYLYWTGDGPTKDPQAFAGLQGAMPVTKEYMKNWSDVAAEYGERYGTKVKGWWIDGSYSWIGHGDETFAILAKGLRAGNPDRILAFNPGVDPKVMAYTDFDDFTAGEQNSFESLPETGRFLKGAQWHILTFLGENWGQPGVKLSKKELAQYVGTVDRLGGVVTVEIILYRDGGLDRSQLETVKAVRPYLDAMTEAAERRRAAGNLAGGAIAFLKSIDETKTLPPSVGDVHGALAGIDGDPNTSAVGANDWAWAYCVYLAEHAAASRVSLLFGQGYPTDFEVLIKAPGGEWESVGRFDNPDGQRKYEIEFAKKEIAGVKIVGWKPDGPDQKGSQMSVAEVEVY